jgi:hypothetical protein
MIEMQRKQLSFSDWLIAEEVSDLREDWMRHANEVLADEEIVVVGDVGDGVPTAVAAADGACLRRAE